MEELVPLVGMGAKEALLALVQLLLEGFNGSSQAPLLCDQAGNVIMCVMVPLELSCNHPVLLGPQVVDHCSVGRVIAERVEKPVGKLPFFVNGDMLGGKQLLSVDWLADTSSAQTVQAIVFDERGKDMDGMVAVSDWDEEIRDVAFILFIPLWTLVLLVPICEPLITVCLPVFIGFFQVSCIHLMLCQSLSLLLEYFQLFMVAVTGLFIFSCNSCQSLSNVEEFFLAWGAVSFKSSTYGPGGEL